jgi:hypothetical protein
MNLTLWLLYNNSCIIDGYGGDSKVLFEVFRLKTFIVKICGVEFNPNSKIENV